MPWRRRQRCKDERVSPGVVACWALETIIEWHRRMIEIAREKGIPAMQNAPLARALNEDGDIDRYIPSELIEPVAEVLRWMQ